jgi:ribosomal protein S18 acetylase RimI-like enzyme
MQPLITYGGPELLCEIEPLWQELNALHLAVSPHFAARYLAFQFAERQAGLERKALAGALRVAIAVHDGRPVGYCVVSVGGNEGEIDSLFVTAHQRGKGLGSRLMHESLAWMRANGAAQIKVVVATGNEAVFGFYEKFGLFPRATTLATLLPDPGSSVPRHS